MNVEWVCLAFVVQVCVCGAARRRVLGVFVRMCVHVCTLGCVWSMFVFACVARVSADICTRVFGGRRWLGWRMPSFCHNAPPGHFLEACTLGSVSVSAQDSQCPAWEVQVLPQAEVGSHSDKGTRGSLSGYRPHCTPTPCSVLRVDCSVPRVFMFGISIYKMPLTPGIRVDLNLAVTSGHWVPCKSNCSLHGLRADSRLSSLTPRFPRRDRWCL